MFTTQTTSIVNTKNTKTDWFIQTKLLSALVMKMGTSRNRVVISTSFAILVVAITVAGADQIQPLDESMASLPWGAMFVLGDSSVDCGDNTPFYLLLHRNQSLFPCNGSDDTLIPQLLAKKMGLAGTVPFYSQNGSIQVILGGLNFGSAQATILYPSSRSFQSLNQQLRQASETIQLLHLNLGQDKATPFIRSSVFYLSFGKDDIIHHLIASPPVNQNLSRILVHQMMNAVRNLYANNARRIVCAGVLPLGCGPRWRSVGSTAEDSCSDEVNNLVSEFNGLMEESVVGMRGELGDARVTFCDVYRAMMEVIKNPSGYGIVDVKNACCGRESGCVSEDMACKDPWAHVWWDLYNPTPLRHLEHIPHPCIKHLNTSISYMARYVQELHFPKLDIPIRIDKIELVLPDSDNIPPDNGQDCLYLSNLDDMVGVRAFTPTIYFYESKDSDEKPIFQTLKDALRKVLVPYYPFSGRLREAKNGKLEVFFGPNQGALLVEAFSDIVLADLGDLSVPNPAWIKLIHMFPDEEPYKVVDMPLIIAQVTRFTCGGFSLGLRMCHCICDGFGAMQFLSAWARTAKAGSLVLNPKPCWDREFFLPRDPPKIEFPHIEFKKIENGSNLIQRLFGQAQEGGKSKFPCTTFDAMAAHVWRSWVKALDVRPLDCRLRLTFSVNARAKLMNPPLKDGFYGNALCVACAVSTVDGLTSGPLTGPAYLVHEARIAVSEDYVRSTVDYIDRHRPERLEFDGKLTVTQWTRFSIYELADFGWGKPLYAGPIDLTPTPQVCLFLPGVGEGESGGGAMVLCICLPESACRRFGELLMNHELK
ncbi:GDSL esterase/lipase [Striga asiatica]|uniref:GDSL esterase/lipase n=1 Tax=Striga asiatica TaxID=4170 RepID=A0A5A7RBB4_STRAF|nr:GDSL esterase/lipase [Striga asiatica]